MLSFDRAPMAVNTLVASHATIDEYGCVYAGLSAHAQLTVCRAVAQRARVASAQVIQCQLQVRVGLCELQTLVFLTCARPCVATQLRDGWRCFVQHAQLPQEGCRDSDTLRRRGQCGKLACATARCSHWRRRYVGGRAQGLAMGVGRAIALQCVVCPIAYTHLTCSSCMAAFPVRAASYTSARHTPMAAKPTDITLRKARSSTCGSLLPET